MTDAEQTKHQGRPAYHHGDLKAAAVQAAMLALDQGGKLPSLRALAQQLGVAHRALYRHFDNREALERELAAVGLHRLADAVSPATDARHVARTYLAFALDQPALYRLVMSSRREAFKADPLLQPLSRLLVALRTSTGWPDDRIQALWLQLHGGVELYQSGLLDVRNRKGFVDWMGRLHARLD